MADKSWTTGNILADKGAFIQEYGYWEARYKYTESAGINNSFWMMSTAAKDQTWYEIDVCEGHYMNKINTNLHEYTTGARVQHSERYATPYDLSKDYHTYAVEWTPEYLKYYFDGQLIHTKNNVTSGGHLSFARLSSAILSWAGAINESANGTAQIADYVRVWQRSGDVADHTIANEHALDGLSACVLEKVEAVDATCTNTGLKEHWKCTICNKYFADVQGSKEINRDSVIIPALGGEHKYIVTDSKEADCEEDGYTVEKCRKCGDVKTTVFLTLGHTVKKIPGKTPTATESGLTEGERCSVCKTVLVAQTEIPSTGGSDQGATPDKTERHEPDEIQPMRPHNTHPEESDEAGPIEADSDKANIVETVHFVDTGDDFNNLWYFLFTISGVGWIILVQIRRKRKQL